MPGQLFTEYFLTDGIRHTQERRSQRQAASDFRNAARRLFRDFGQSQDPNEAETEQNLIIPLLRHLGWTDYLPQQGTSRREEIPDQLLFADTSASDRARTLRSADSRYAEALAVQESKRFRRSLDIAGRADSPEPQATQSAMLDLPRVSSGSAPTPSPHRQMLRYLQTADQVTDGDLRWGVLTNGSVWRLYDQKTRPRSTAFYEADLEALINDDDEDGIRTFHLLFRRAAFIRLPGASVTFLEFALNEGRRYEQRVAKSLAGVVFERVFPRLLQALADATGKPMPEIREAALVFLYRLLFVLYAEDRGLLPVNDPDYDDYGLRKPVRDSVAQRKARHDTFSSAASTYYDHLTNLFRLIDQGDQSIGLPPYNGGLFAMDASEVLNQARLPDNVIADVLYDLSHTNTNGQPSYVNYRDMSVQQLGSIYERLLEQEPVLDGEGRIRVRPNPYARKDSGSFYTPQDLVDLIVEQTLTPLVDERRAVFEAKACDLRSDRRPKAVRKRELAKLDPAEAVLDLKVLDPAMGSGHFLVTAVDFLAETMADLIEYSHAVPDWLAGDDVYHSPLLDRVAAIRDAMLQRAAEFGWKVDKSQLTDHAIIRRLVLKRCIYGVDKSPLTVELAKVSLWLHSFTVGSPLSFLDHHLRCGDSLIGLSLADAKEELQRLKVPMFAASALQGIENAAQGIRQIERLSDADVSEVHESQSLFKSVESATADLRGFLDALCGLRWLTAGMKVRERTDFESPIAETLAADPSSAIRKLARDPIGDSVDVSSKFRERLTEARSIASQVSFFHWEVAFAGVWQRWQDEAPKGGFDAVIGNPPWDRIKLQEVEWFALRKLQLARSQTASARRAGIQRLREDDLSLSREFDLAKAHADRLSQIVRKSGQYPLLGRGDINLYALFVERALRVLKPRGLVGLLTPSGIYADKTAAPFFKAISTAGRLAGLYDFENRRSGTDLPPFFPDVDSRQKFCALIIGGLQRNFHETTCGFFLPDTKTMSDSDRAFTLAPADFSRVNPNTGTAPVFRTRRDAELTTRIYRELPVLVSHLGDDESRVWPVRYYNMFHMTNDSHLFRTTAQLEDEGCYRVRGNLWKRGKEMYFPLYEGKMVQAFDHRAASVVVNPRNIHRPAQRRDTTLIEHEDPDSFPEPQFWVSDKYIEWPKGLSWAVAFKDATSTTNFRSMIASVIPRAAVGNTLPLLLPDDEGLDDYRENACLWVACLNSLVYDYIARQKVQGQHLNWYIVEQIPVLESQAYRRRFGDHTAADLVRDHVLRLTYTSHDMAPFARDLAHDGRPFPWNEEDRRHLRARLDALFFHLYGLDREDTAYILSTFPIIQRQDEAEFGRYRTRELILHYMNALAAGDTESRVAP